MFNKHSLIVGELTRAADLCSDENLLLVSVLTIFVEFARLGYPDTAMLKAFHTTKNKKPSFFNSLPSPNLILEVARQFLPIV